jgi:hypothetical protein
LNKRSWLFFPYFINHFFFLQKNIFYILIHCRCNLNFFEIILRLSNRERLVIGNFKISQYCSVASETPSSSGKPCMHKSILQGINFREWRIREDDQPSMASQLSISQILLLHQMQVEKLPRSIWCAMIITARPDRET